MDVILSVRGSARTCVHISDGEGTEVVYDNIAWDFGLSAVANRILSAIVFLAQRDCHNIISRIIVCHKPSCVAMTLHGVNVEYEAPLKSPKNRRKKAECMMHASCWYFLGKLLGKVNWGIVCRTADV